MARNQLPSVHATRISGYSCVIMPICLTATIQDGGQTGNVNIYSSKPVATTNYWP